MLNVLIAGVGGQGSVLASRILAQAALSKGWQVRTAETIGMAQRGGSVLGHVRMGNEGEQVHAPLVSPGAADCVIALEPGEGLRALEYLSGTGLMVVPTTGIPSVMTNLTGGTYDVASIVRELQRRAANVAVVDAQAVVEQVGNPKVLNVVMLAAAVHLSNERACGLRSSITLPELEEALAASVKPQFLELNKQAIAAAVASCAARE